MSASAPLVDAEGVSAIFRSRGFFRPGPGLTAVNRVSLTIMRSEAVGVVGESGSGKSTLGRLLLGLLAANEGRVRFDGSALDSLARPDWLRLRQRAQIVFQDPYSSLDPRRRVGSQITDGLAIHGLANSKERTNRARELLALVGLDAAHAERFPHEFSGGQRQRIGIARAIATRPDFLVLDEPVSSLDVSIQAQILDLLAKLRAELGLAFLFISHDLPVVQHLCDRVVVMYLGRIMEQGPAKAVFEAPAHPYTRALLSATPRIHAAARRTRITLPGDPPSPTHPPTGCVFRTRCQHAEDACSRTVPPLQPVGLSHLAACLRLDQVG
ncbi:AppF ABC-type oligopeptide transport system, ATPase component [Rhabdaerophilaceae bacterium]